MLRTLFVFACCLSLLTTSCTWDYLEPYVEEPDTTIIIIDTSDTIHQTPYSTEIQPIWDANCLDAGCHEGSFAPNLTAAVSYNELWFSSLLICTSYSSCIDTADPESSLIYLKIKPGPPCGNIMPGGGLPQSEIDSVKKWIEQGAQDN